jgi:hypothetical protein
MSAHTLRRTAAVLTLLLLPAPWGTVVRGADMPAFSVTPAAPTSHDSVTVTCILGYDSTDCVFRYSGDYSIRSFDWRYPPSYEVLVNCAGTGERRGLQQRDSGGTRDRVALTGMYEGRDTRGWGRPTASAPGRSPMASMAVFLVVGSRSHAGARSLVCIAF